MADRDYWVMRTDSAARDYILERLGHGELREGWAAVACVINREEAAVGGTVVVVTAGTATGAAHPGAVGPILAFVGVILVALMTACFSKQRQAEQLQAEQDRQAAVLRAERARQDAALRADGERLQQQLAHERQLHDLGELRVIDEALRNAELAENRFLDVQRVVVRDTFDQELTLRLTMPSRRTVGLWLTPRYA